MVRRPRLLSIKKARPARRLPAFRTTPPTVRKLRAVAGHVFKFAPSLVVFFAPSPSRHFDPMAPSVCEAGAGQPFAKFRKILQVCFAVPICLAKGAISPCRYLFEALRQSLRR